MSKRWNVVQKWMTDLCRDRMCLTKDSAVALAEAAVACNHVDLKTEVKPHSAVVLFSCSRCGRVASAMDSSERKLGPKSAVDQLNEDFFAFTIRHLACPAGKKEPTAPVSLAVDEAWRQ